MNSHLTNRSIPARDQWRLEQAGIHPLLARLYAARGISHPDEVDYALSRLVPPSALMGAGEAATLLADALEARSTIVIVGDYDCDGATGTAVALRVLRLLVRSMPGGGGGRIEYLIPSRFTQGYGLSVELVEVAAKEFAPGLLVTVDNGIASVDAVARARELGIRTLVTDHHLPGQTLPQADCIVNPNQPGCPFPSKHLAGVGVIFYVMLALRAELRRRGWFSTVAEPNLADLLDLVALGTVADVVVLDHNNRILVAQGLQRIRSGKMQPGVAALFAAAQKNAARATCVDLGFILGPRLNAAGRLADMNVGIDCLTTDDAGRASAIAWELDRINRERRQIEARMLDQALERLDEAGDVEPAPGVALFDPSWHQGIVGILASRIKDRLHRPVFAFARGNNGELKGSGRSIPGLHLRDLLDRIAKTVPGLILRFGGHAAAAGLTIAETDFPRFCHSLALTADELIDPDDLRRTIVTDGVLETGYFGIDTIRMLDEQIWGQGFPAPLFKDRFHVTRQRVLKEKHLKMVLEKNGARFDAIIFGNADPADKEIEAAYRLQINDFNGVQSTQLLIERWCQPG